jgi:hypothetical protein
MQGRKTIKDLANKVTLGVNSGIYIVQLLNEDPMPVTRDLRYVDTCARVNRDNIKIGKANDFERRKKNYYADFDMENVIFEELYKIEDTRTAEKLIKRKLNPYRNLSPKGGKLEWLEGISYSEAKRAIAEVIEVSDLDYEPY